MKVNYEPLKLDNQLCFALYACSREITKLYKPALDKLGITYTQYISLLVLWEKDNITVKEMGKKLHLDSGTLTPLLKKLECMELVNRTRDTVDERKVFVKLTEKGIELKEMAIEIPNRILCSTGLTLQSAELLKENITSLLLSLTPSYNSK
ncbi:MarR family transcriptional regulator [Clostridium tagluense]|nr:MarR family transcriptional regulator [Clostridium tagluense]MCB2314559.1 MarR family transcriptional regulator [Clostridium tagluense]MCB2319407.1 MarR family transcriptional regulator [Clostridium tagluense]MCB2324505.1 MarR family transcriptional regulator [Clostridium tagluense]MCB2329356.1 MarR family transcriptional regulator [Clostridium tagluense]